MKVLPVSVLLLLVWYGSPAKGEEARVQIRSPKDGSRVVQEQNTVLVSGKVSTEGFRTPSVDLFFVLDVSGSTAHYAGVDFGGTSQASSLPPRPTGPQIGIFGGSIGIGKPRMTDFRNSILAAEVAAAQRLLLQLDPGTTRTGLIVFSDQARLIQPLTHDFELLRRGLSDLLTEGPYGGTHMAAGIRLAIKELAGLGRSEPRPGSTRAQLLLTDGFPTLPVGGGKMAAPEDMELAINAARVAGKAGTKIHVFALGEEALSRPQAAVGIARESRGSFTPVARPADILNVLENISVVGVEYIEVTNETTGQKAKDFRLAADGFFSSALPVAEGLNRIQVLARASNGALARDSISVHYAPGSQRSLELEVFLEKERALRSEAERLGKNRQQIQREIEQAREDSLKKPGVPQAQPASPQ